MNKTITLIGINYYPEDTAVGIYSTQMLEYLSQKGFKINVLTGFPYYPEWKIKNDYQNKPKFYKEVINNINIYRYKQYVPKKPTFLKRIIHLFDFTLGTYINSFKIKQTDLVIAIVPFTSTILLGWLLKKRLKAKLWTHIQDFEFDAAQQAGVSKNKKNLLFKILFKIEKKLIDCSDEVSTISQTMLKKLKSKTGCKTYYFPNWINQDSINPSKNNTHTYLKSNNFKVLYSGSIGDKQNWSFFIKFLFELKKIDNIEVIIVGQGSQKKWLSKKIKLFDFVKIYNPVPLNELNDLLCSANLHILFQKDNVLDTVMPSKILGMIASGVPSLITGHPKSEVAKIIHNSKGGIYLQNNLIEVLNAFNKLKSDKSRYYKIGENARHFVIKNYDYNSILSEFEMRLKKLLKIYN